MSGFLMMIKTNQQRQVKKVFENHANKWFKKASKNEKNSINIIKQRNHFVEETARNLLKKVDKALDVGCGSGDLVLALQKAKFDAYGIDFARSMIKKATLRANRLGLDTEKFSTISFFDYKTDLKFKMISANGFIEYISEQEWKAHRIPWVGVPGRKIDGKDNNGNGLIDENESHLSFGQSAFGVAYADGVDNDGDAESGSPLITAEMISAASSDWAIWPPASENEGYIHLIGITTEDDLGKAFADGIDNDEDCSGDLPYNGCELDSPVVNAGMISASKNDNYGRYFVKDSQNNILSILYSLDDSDLGKAYADGIDNDGDGEIDEGIDKGIDEPGEIWFDGNDNDGDGEIDEYDEIGRSWIERFGSYYSTWDSPDGGFGKYMFDEENLIHILTSKGFRNVNQREFDPDIDLKERDYESIYAEATK